MGAQFTTNALSASNSSLDTETVVITRSAITGFPPVNTETTVYSGAADFQDSAQSIVYNPAGEVQMATADIVIDPAADGTLPSLLAGDAVTVGGNAYGVVVSATVWNAAPRHLEVVVKRGPIAYGP